MYSQDASGEQNTPEHKISFEKTFSLAKRLKGHYTENENYEKYSPVTTCFLGICMDGKNASHLAATTAPKLQHQYNNLVQPDEVLLFSGCFALISYILKNLNIARKVMIRKSQTLKNILKWALKVFTFSLCNFIRGYISTYIHTHTHMSVAKVSLKHTEDVKHDVTN